MTDRFPPRRARSDPSGRAAPPPGAARTGGQPRPRAPRKAGARSRAWLLSPRRSGPGFPRDPRQTPALPGQPGCRPQLAAPPSREGDLWRSPGAYRSEARARGDADGRRAGLRHGGRGAPGSSPPKLSWASAARAPSPASHPAPQQQANQPGRRRPPLAPPPPSPLPADVGAGPRGCPGDTQCLCSEPGERRDGGPVPLAVAAPAAAAGEGGGGLQELQLPDCEEHRRVSEDQFSIQI